MKATIVFFLLMGSIIPVIGQITQYSQPAQQGIIDQYVSPDWNELHRLGQMMKEDHERNRQYADNLIDWIYKLKKEINEEEFLNSIEKYLSFLLSLDGGLANAESYLKKVENGVKTEIDNYNTRLKELPVKLWKSGNQHDKNKEYEDAIIDYTKLIQLNPQFSYVYKNRGYIYYEQKKYQLALADFNKAIELKGDEPSFYYYRGWLKFDLKDLQSSLIDFNKLIELDSNSSLAYFARARVKSHLSDPIGSISDNTKCILLDPNNSMAYNNRGWEKFELKLYKEALKDVDKAIALDSLNSTAYDSRQEIKFALNDLKGCLADCDKAILLTPEFANPYFFRGRVYFKIGKKVKACENWNKAGELGLIKAYEFITKYCSK